MNTLHSIALALAIVGALNWGLVGLLRFDLVAALFGGEASPMSRLVYVLVGISGVLLVFTSSAFRYRPNQLDRPARPG